MKIISHSCTNAFLVMVAMVFCLYPTTLTARTWLILPDGTGDAPTIQAGIDSSLHYDTVLIAPGTYNECIDFSSKKITVGSYFLTTQDTTYISQTVIDGTGINRSVATFANGENYSSMLCGLTLAHGMGIEWIFVYGGGVYCRNSNPILRHLIIRDSHPTRIVRGGGIACLLGAAPLIEHVRIENNHAGEGGGIICEIDCSPTIRNSVICHNSGGGIATFYNVNLQLENVELSDNDMAFYNQGDSYCEFVNVTVAHNLTQGIFMNGGHVTIVNSVLWHNDWPEIRCWNNSSVAISHTDIEGGSDGIEYGTIHWLDGNIDSDPLFVAAEVGDFRLAADSPCIDSGTDYFEWEDEVIVDRSPAEYCGTSPDMGAWENCEVTTAVRQDIPATRLQISVHPNPCNPITTIRFSLPGAWHTRLDVYAVDGRHVACLLDRPLATGSHAVSWSGSDSSGRAVASGTYICRLEAGVQVVTERVILVR